MVKPQITPLGNKVLIQPLIKQEKTTAGIIIPTMVNRDIDEAIVVAVADHVINITVGDKILYPSRKGDTYLYGDINYKFLDGPTTTNPGDIIAII